jgi:hypothetical protein
MSLTLTNIPRIMRSHGWANGARLMEIWFSRPAATAPAYGAPETATIRLDAWALTYQRAREVYDRLMRERVWANAAAQREIASMLRRRRLLGSRPQAFGNLNQPVHLLDADYINYRAVGGGYGYYSYYYYYYSGLDDMTAALGNFVFRVAVAGNVAPVSGGRGHRVTITDVGVYLRDSYDFNGDQHLGFWDDSDNSVSGWNALSGTQVTNEDFRNHRAATGRGGDFLVFSDVKQTHLATPDTFVVT